MKERFVLLSEVINELQKELENNGDKQVISIGTRGGDPSMYVFHLKGDLDSPIDRVVNIRCFRSQK